MEIINSNTQINTIAAAKINTSVPLDISGTSAKGYCVMITTVVNSPAAGTFAAAAVNVTNSTATITSHGYATGLVGQLTTTGTLPTGLSTLTNYYIIVKDANTVQFASSQANALAGTFIPLTGQGTGNNTFTPTALAGLTVKLQGSNDNINWGDLASATSISGSGTLAPFNMSAQFYQHVQAVFAITSGQVTITANTTVKG